MDWLWWWPSAPPSESEVTSEISPRSLPPEATVYQAASTPNADSLEAESISPARGATAQAPDVVDALRLAPKLGQWCSFVDTYGRIAGPSLVVGVLGALVWTVFLVCINIAPTWTINRLFSTGEIDDGDFWLLSSPKTTGNAIIIACLVGIAVYYLYLLILLCWKRKETTIIDDYEEPSTSCCTTCLCDFMKNQFNVIDTESRPYLKVSEELPEIAYQSVVLSVFMKAGVSPDLILIFASVMAVNCFTRCVRVLANTTYHERNDSLTNSLFQFFFAVVFPVTQLIVAAVSFTIDRHRCTLRIQYFEIGSFERLARFAQPGEYLSTHATSRTLVELLILGNKTGLAIGVVGMHIALLWRWHDIVLGCLLGYKKQRLPMTSVALDSTSLLGLVRLVKALYWFFIKLVLVCVCVNKRFIPHIFTLLWLGFGTGVLVMTSVGIVYSKRACEPFEGRCALQAFEFHGLSSTNSNCPCIMYVNQPKAPVQWTDWINRPDVTQELSQVAVTGRIQSIQIVNRDLVALPDTVGDCMDLRELVLVRTGLQTFPSWLSDLEELQVLHVTGDLNTTITSFPQEMDILKHHTNLRSIRLENLRALSSLPSFPERALPSLRSVVLIDLPMVRSIPVMGHLEALRILLLAQLPTLQRLPLLPSHLVTLRVEMPTALCCNGYLKETCPATTNSSILTQQCKTLGIETNTTTECLESDFLTTTQTVATQLWFHNTHFDCDLDTKDLDTITETSVVVCNGQMYRECSLNNASGMCLGTNRLEIVHCVVPKDVRIEAMGRVELKHDPTICQREAETWLGCRGL